MTSYRFKLSGSTFSAGTDKEFVAGLRSFSHYPIQDDMNQIRSLASLYSNLRKKPFRFSSIPEFRSDMLRHGVLEVVDA